MNHNSTKTPFCGMEKMSLVDFEGKVACVLFVGGCNYRCPFCHNSDIVLNHSKMPKLAHDEIFEYLNARKKILDAVVISGGEPLLYNITEIIKQIKAMGFLVKLDTNGSNPKDLQKLLDLNLLDYIAMDIKNDLDNYQLTAGAPNLNLDSIKKSIKIIQNSGIDYEFRTTLVQQFHGLKQIQNIAKLLKNSKKYFLQKFVDNGTCFQNKLTAVEKETALSFKNYLSKFITQVSLRGYD